MKSYLWKNGVKEWGRANRTGLGPRPRQGNKSGLGPEPRQGRKSGLRPAPRRGPQGPRTPHFVGHRRARSRQAGPGHADDQRERPGLKPWLALLMLLWVVALLCGPVPVLAEPEKPTEITEEETAVAMGVRSCGRLYTASILGRSWAAWLKAPDQADVVAARSWENGRPRTETGHEATEVRGPEVFRDLGRSLKDQPRRVDLTKEERTVD